MIKAVIFDMDGLLIDSEPFWRKAEIEGFSKVGIDLSEDDCRETMGYRLNEVVDLWYTRQPWQGVSLKEVEMDILNLVAHYISTEGKPLKGALETFKAAKTLGLKTAIASSSPMVLINSVVALLAMEEVDVLHSAQFEAYGKPHPAVFMTAAKKLNVAPADCLVLEDSFHGMVAALAAKMKVVVVPEPTHRHNPKFKAADLVIDSLEDLRLENWTGPKPIDKN